MPSQYSEISMSVTATAIEFAQGQVVQTSQATHFAIKDRANIVGANFFPGGPLQFPTFATVTPAGTLGYSPGVPGSCM